MPCVRPAPEAHGSPLSNDKALRPDPFETPSRAGGVRVESEACLDAAEHDGRRSRSNRQALPMVVQSDAPAHLL